MRNGNIVAANMVTLTLSLDHRALDGAVGAAFLKALKSYIENPTATTWNSITEATQKNPGWDAGCFSQVSNVHDQITRLKNTDNDFEGNHSGPNTH